MDQPQPPPPPSLPSPTYFDLSQPSTPTTVNYASEEADLQNPRLIRSSVQPPYPSPSPPVAAATPDFNEGIPQRRRSLRNAIPQLPSDRLLRLQLEAQRTAKLWNPSNSTPRRPKTEARSNLTGYQSQYTSRPRTKREPAVPLKHPQLRGDQVEDEEYIDLEAQTCRNNKGKGKEVAGSYPLLSLKEQRNSKQGLARPSLQVELSDRSIRGLGRTSPLPRGLSLDKLRNESLQPQTDRKGKGKGKATESYPAAHLKTSIMAEVEERQKSSHGHAPSHSFSTGGALDGMAQAVGLSEPKPTHQPPPVVHHDNGYQAQQSHHQHNHSLASSSTDSVAHSIPPSLSPSTVPWGPAHPCYPHPNPHVPMNSDKYEKTRVIRIPRDYMAAGDLYPQYSSLFPELLMEAGIGEEKFRECIARINRVLMEVYMPAGVSGVVKAQNGQNGGNISGNRSGRNFLDGVLGLLTGWLWDDTGLLGIKSGVERVEGVIRAFNKELEHEGKDARWISLRGTAYLSLDIQIPTPQIAFIENEEAESIAGPPTTSGTEQQARPQMHLGGDGSGDGSGEYKEKKLGEL